jgi:CheY-like chemotaxis protein
MAVKHESGIVGFAKTEMEAWSLVERLAAPTPRSILGMDESATKSRRSKTAALLRRALVLIVENEALIAIELASQVGDLGHEVLIAADADIALAMLVGGLDAELLVTDIKMPGAMDGLDLARCASVAWPMMKIIVLSGVSERAAPNLPHGSLFLPKPCEPEIFSKALSKMICGREAAMSARGAPS